MNRLFISAIYYYLLFLLSPVVLMAQAGQTLFKQAPGGLLYHIYVHKGGPAIQPGDFISMGLTVKNDRDSIIYNSYENGRPSVLFVEKGQYPGDIYTGLTFLSEGDSAIIKLNIDSLSKAAHKNAPVKGKYTVYNIKVEKVIAKSGLSEKAFSGLCRDYIKSLTVAARKREPARIKNYIDDYKQPFTKTSSGLNYIIVQKGSGPNAAVGDTVVMNYTGRFINGKIFDTSIRTEIEKAKMPDTLKKFYGPVRFAVGGTNMIEGWEEGVQLLNKGTKALFIIPSDMGYGEKGNGRIPPFEPLIFEVELVDIIHADQN